MTKQIKTFEDQQKLSIKEGTQMINRLIKRWNATTMLMIKLRVYKEDKGMNRDREELLNRCNKLLLDARTLMETVIQSIQNQVNSQKILLKTILEHNHIHKKGT